MSFFSTGDNTQIYYTDGGSGDAVILIHGWPLSSAMWEYQRLALLERGFRVIAYDRRGFGRSSQPATRYDYDTLADDLKGLVDHLHLTQFSLVGFSMGGGEVARFLSRHGSHRVASAALISSVVPYMLKTKTNPKGVPGSQLDKMMNDLKSDRPHFLSSFNKILYGVSLIHSAVSEETIQWSAAVEYEASLFATIRCVESFGKTDFRPDLSSFRVPTLIIHGTADKNVPIGATSEQCVRVIPNAIFKRYEGAPHGLFITHMKELNADLTSFLSMHSRKLDISSGTHRSRAYSFLATAQRH